MKFVIQKYMLKLKQFVAGLSNATTRQRIWFTPHCGKCSARMFIRQDRLSHRNICASILHIFSKVSEQELAEIENIVNEKITENIQLQHWRNIPFEEAQKMGALMFFGDKYGDKVNVVQFDDFSKEFCGGTHVKNTSDIGFFKIRSETSSASGVRRIEAITNEYAVEFLKNENKTYKELVERGYQLIDEIQISAERSRSVKQRRFSIV